MYNPEFLTEATAWWDFTRPNEQILGIPHSGLKLAKDIFEILPQAPILRVISPKDAEILKHARNSFYATKVIFFNQLYDMCQELGGDYETVRESMVLDPRIGDSHSIVMHKGYRGFGTQDVSKCLPKDTLAFSKIAHSDLLNKVLELNTIYYEQKN
jgi:UDPglucose 6-dehydrogenase